MNCCDHLDCPKCPSWTPSSIQQTGCDVRQPGRPCYNWVTGGKTALSWLHNYHDLLLWSIAEQAVSRATINHCYLHRNKSWGAIIGNHNSHEFRFIITHLWLFRYITKVSQKGKNCTLHPLEDSASPDRLPGFTKVKTPSLTGSPLVSDRSGWALGSAYRMTSANQTVQ